MTSVLGYGPQDLLGKVAFDFYHPDDQSHMKDTFDQGQMHLCFKMCLPFLFFLLFLCLLSVQFYFSLTDIELLLQNGISHEKSWSQITGMQFIDMICKLRPV